MTYSYTQISQYLACPKRYKHRYLHGWREKETRASLLFGRVFEQALSAYFFRQDPTEVLFREWFALQDTQLEYANGDSWEKMYRQGIVLLERFAQDNRVRVLRLRRNLQIKLSRPLGNGNEFRAYVDAIGLLDGTRSVIEWKTTTSRYPEEPEGLLSLDPQLICYSWLTGIEDVAVVAFVRKRLPEIQYLKTRISEEQRQDYARLVEETISRIEAGHFLPHSGIRFPQNGCLACPFLGLCLENQELIDIKLVRKPGASDLDWLRDIDY
ncbi:PD-(D/E)XK nuclease family protein [Acidobacteriia bacterium AH_259_A11_L15]|nr:PD-(D/E)XK nuclease family protein [Acidobacteriia bacterium AH_259_A11_L15]